MKYSREEIHNFSAQAWDMVWQEMGDIRHQVGNVLYFQINRDIHDKVSELDLRFQGIAAAYETHNKLLEGKQQNESDS
jgi:hypothetical protein